MQSAGPLRCLHCVPAGSGATMTAPKDRANAGSAFTLYCRRCKARLVAAAPSSDAPTPRTAISYGGVTFGATCGAGEKDGEGEHDVA